MTDYRVSRRLYKGDCTAVYQATCLRSGMEVALKTYDLRSVPSNTLHMIRREIEIHSQLHHRHIAQMYGAFLDGVERVVAVQEFGARGDLFGFFRRRPGGRLPHYVAGVAVVRPLLEALSYMHSVGICHRDIKPENVLLGEGWRLMVADLGLAIDLLRERAVTRAGTQGYMAPEVERCPLKNAAADNKDRPDLAYTTAADVYGVGILAYELMTGQLLPPPAKPDAAGGGNGAAAAAGAVQPPQPALVFPASVPASARDFILAAVSPHPEERPTAVQLLQHMWLAEAAEAADLVRRQTGAAAAAAAAAAGAAATGDAAGGTAATARLAPPAARPPMQQGLVEVLRAGSISTAVQ
ncbi:hypothetical protein HXX76_013321 [Chlamydomonas incerta]|uniref:Protein kinase domain-containing protein n=1 Tax=Chlamydomonas incerta TaxID=51695 RepID=A0A835SEV0_CHLIN|nr:hypothetical protein HXX76_013321 [Chlamydomonas incerta]|eukprot:KAG2425948.1 hypothetical protein HXX76_013321 [Chlamydomonas incerta]